MIEAVKQRVWNFGCIVAFARGKAPESGHCGKRGNDENDDRDFKKHQHPVCERLQSGTHRNVRQRSEFRGYKNRQCCYLGRLSGSPIVSPRVDCRDA
jgi:hypothetical protein